MFVTVREHNIMAVFFFSRDAAPTRHLTLHTSPHTAARVAEETTTAQSTETDRSTTEKRSSNKRRKKSQRITGKEVGLGRERRETTRGDRQDTHHQLTRPSLAVFLLDLDTSCLDTGVQR